MMFRKRIAPTLNLSFLASTFALGALFLLSTNAFANPFSAVPTMLSQSSCSELGDPYMPQASELVGHWKLNESAGSTSVVDLSTTGANGTVVGGVTLGVQGQLKTASQFTNSSTYINMGLVPALQLNYPFTVSAWVKPNAFSSTGSVIGSFDSSGTYGGYRGYNVRIETSGAVSAATGSGAAACGPNGRRTFVSSVGVVQLGKWAFVSVVFQSATVRKIYVNGIDRTNSSGTSGNNASIAYGSNNVFRIGHYFTGNSGSCNTTEGFNGVVDNVAIWKSALTESEIRTVYDQQSCGKN